LKASSQESEENFDAPVSIGIPTARRIRSDDQEVSRGVSERSDRTPTSAETIAVSLYIDNEQIHEEVEAAVVELLNTAGYIIEHREDAITGSWSRRMRAAMRKVANDEATEEVAKTLAHAAESRAVLAKDAYVTATLMQNLGPLIAALQPTKDAVIRVGALLVVKVEWVVAVHQLTARQQLILDHQPQLLLSPRDILVALGLNPPMPVAPPTTISDHVSRTPAVLPNATAGSLSADPTRRLDG